MKSMGIILIVLGIAMFVFRSFSYTQEKNVINAGPIQINTKEHKTVVWPMYGGGIAIIAGVVMLLAGKNKSK